MTLFMDMFLENTGVLFDFNVDFPCCINTPALPKSHKTGKSLFNKSEKSCKKFLNCLVITIDQSFF